MEMDDLRQERQKNRIKSVYRKLNIKAFLWKHKYKILIFLILLLIAVFPAQIGQFIGNWIHEFITNFKTYL